MTPALLLVGYGNVARRFVRLLDESRGALVALGLYPVVVGVATRRHGSVFDGRGIGADDIDALLVPEERPRTSSERFITTSLAALRAVPA